MLTNSEPPMKNRIQCDLIPPQSVCSDSWERQQAAGDLCSQVMHGSLHKQHRTQGTLAPATSTAPTKHWNIYMQPKTPQPALIKWLTNSTWTSQNKTTTSQKTQIHFELFLPGSDFQYEGIFLSEQSHSHPQLSGNKLSQQESWQLGQQSCKAHNSHLLAEETSGITFRLNDETLSQSAKTKETRTYSYGVLTIITYTSRY